MQTTVNSRLTPRRAHRIGEQLATDQSEPPSQPVTLSTWLAALGCLIVVLVLVAAIILGPKSMPETASTEPPLRRVNPSIIMTTMTPAPTPEPSPTPTATPQSARLLASGLAGESNMTGLAISCAAGSCDNVKGAFVWVCWSGRVVESTARLYEFLTLSNLPGCVKAARLDGTVARNQAFSISSNTWTALAGSMPGFKLLVLELYDTDYPAPFTTYEQPVVDPERPVKASPPN